MRRQCPSMYETLDVLKHLPEKICSEEFLIPEVLKLDVSEEDMEREHRWVADMMPCLAILTHDH